MRIIAHILSFIALASLFTQNAMAQSILRDAETEALLQDMVAPLVEAAGLHRGNVDVILVNDPSINAFVARGQAIYVHSGLIEAADTALEVQGVLAHELGHITGGHAIRFDEGFANYTKVSVLSMILAAAALAAGAGDAAMGVLSAGQTAAVGKFLAFSRAQESSADAAGAQFLSEAGLSGRGSLAFFKKLQNQEFRYGYSQDDDAQYGRTHPMSGDRIQTLRETYVVDPAWNKPDDAALQARFQRVKAKLFGFVTEPARVLQKFPETRTDLPARYARAYAYHKEAQLDKAVLESDALLAVYPNDPYFLELKGQVLLESGRAKDALEPLRRATALTNNSPLIATLFGHALIATEDRAHYEEAETVLRLAVAKDRLNPFAWYQLGVVYAAKGDIARARLASAEQQVMSGQYAAALYSATTAESLLPKGTPDWIRAQDVALEARGALEASTKRR